MFIPKSFLAVLLMGCLAGFAGCGPKDPKTEVLEQRARWDLTPQGFLEKEDGRMVLTLGVSGPARSTIERLTFRVDFRDPDGQELDRVWRTIDLSVIPLGVGTDVTIDLGKPPEGFVVDGDPPLYGEIVVDPVRAPNAEESLKIEELQF